jgi:hypothetical protein
MTRSELSASGRTPPEGAAAEAKPADPSAVRPVDAGSADPSAEAAADAAPADPMDERAADIAADDPGHPEPDEVGPTAPVVDDPAPPERTPVAVARGVLRTMRPKQWVKNVLVLAAPFAGGVLFSGGMALELVVAFVAFSLAASGIYLVNDANDVAADRAHPTKRRRPIAAGIVPVRLAFGVAVVLLAAAVGSACSRTGGSRPWSASTSRCSSPTASGSSTSPCSTSASSRPASCSARSRAARPPASRCRSGSCSPPGSARCSWWRASATPR